MTASQVQRKNSLMKVDGLSEKTLENARGALLVMIMMMMVVVVVAVVMVMSMILMTLMTMMMFMLVVSKSV